MPSIDAVNVSYPLTTTVETNKPLQISMRVPHWKHALDLHEQSTYMFVLPAGMFFNSSGLTVALKKVLKLIGEGEWLAHITEDTYAVVLQEQGLHN